MFSFQKFTFIYVTQVKVVCPAQFVQLVVLLPHNTYDIIWRLADRIQSQYYQDRDVIILRTLRIQDPSRIQQSGDRTNYLKIGPITGR